jgi:hypothetical protein
MSAERRPVDRSPAAGQETRRRILAAAENLFSERGYEMSQSVTLQPPRMPIRHW